MAAEAAMKITETEKYFVVHFPYDKNKVDAISQIPGAWFNRKTKEWNVLKYRHREIEDFKKRFGYVEKAQEVEPERFGQIEPLPELSTEMKDFFAKNLKLTPFHYQEGGIAYNLEKSNVLIGDQPGLGKTGQAIASVFAKNAFPCIVVCPNTLKLNWKREWEMWTGKRAIILSNKLKTSWPAYYRAGMCDIFIVNYESLPKFFVDRYTNDPGKSVKLEDIVFKDTITLFRSLIIDEAHKIKNANTLNAKHCAGLSYGKQMVMRLLLSGTFVTNGPKDLWSPLAMIGMHKRFGPKQVDFIRRYCEVGQARKPGNLKELNYYLTQYCYYRREKHEVLKDLPPKIRQVLSCEITNRKEYDIAENEFIRYLKELKKCTPEEMMTKLRGGFMVKMGILKNISAKGKLEQVRDYCDEIFDAGEKVVLFCNLISMCNEIAAMFPGKMMIINGEVPADQRQAIVDRFQKDPNILGVVCNYKAGGVGLTLTAASRVGMVEEPWTFADCEQCEDRCHRVGQKGMSEGLESIQCTYFLGKDTIDEYIHYDIVMEKKKIADIIHGSDDKTATNVIDSLLKMFGNRGKKEED